MAMQSIMSSDERAAATAWTETENRRLSQEFAQRNVNPDQNLGRDDFLRILLTQLAHQDPTAPMQDTDFIAQMAQFSSLEQMTNLASDFARMTRMFQASEASTALGRSVEIHLENETVHGQVLAVTRGETPQILVNGRFFDWDQVSSIFQED